jgi:hypothetical protein
VYGDLGVGDKDVARAKTCRAGVPVARLPTAGRSTAASVLAGLIGTVTEKMSAVWP